MSDTQFACWGGGVVFLCILLIITGLSSGSKERRLQSEIAQLTIQLAECVHETPALRQMLEHEREYH